VRIPNWVGDVVMATPVFKLLKERFPNAKLTVMCQKNVYAVVQKDPHIDDFFAFKRPSGWLHHKSHTEIVETIQTGEYDLGILLTNSFSSAWWFFRGNVKQRLGYKGHFRSLLLTQALPYPKNVESQHLVLTYQQLLEPLEIHPVQPEAPHLYLDQDEMNHAKETLRKFGYNFGESILIGVNPGAAFGSAKCWLPERFREVTELLLRHPNLYVVYFGDPTGAPLVDQICHNAPERVINLAGKTSLRELIALINCCDMVLTNDSGPMHIAAALKKPLVALFGSTSDIKTGPYGGGKVIHKRVECSPCYKRVCPIDFRCMKKITVSEVCEELEGLFKKNEPA